jgi:hypothetical protein
MEYVGMVWVDRTYEQNNNLISLLYYSFLTHFSSLTCATFPTYLILFDLTILIICGKEFKLQSLLCSFLQPPFTSLILGPNILFSTVFKHPNLWSSLNPGTSFTSLKKHVKLVMTILVFTFFCYETGRYRTLKFMVASNLPNLICCHHSQIYKPCHGFEEFNSYICIMFCPVVW